MNRNNNIGFRVVVASPMLLFVKAIRLRLLAEAGNAVHSRMTAEAETREIARSCPGRLLSLTLPSPEGRGEESGEYRRAPPPRPRATRRGKSNETLKVLKTFRV